MPPLNPQNFGFVIIVGRGIMRLLRLNQGISLGFHRATPTIKNLDYSLLWEGCIMLLLRLSQVFNQGATIPPLHPNIFLDLSLLREGGLILLLRISQRISSGCHHATVSPIISNFHYCGKGALCFCFDLAEVFLQGATLPLLHPNFWGKCYYCGKGHYAPAST